MQTFALSRGDLVLGQQSFVTVDGGAKVSQDLIVATLEPFGCDRFHPGWGSVLGSFVGTPTNRTTPQQVRSEINRLVSNYIATQSAVQTVYANRGQSNPYGAADIVSGIGGFSFSQQTTTVTATVVISTLAGTVTLTASGGGL